MYRMWVYNQNNTLDVQVPVSDTSLAYAESQDGTLRMLAITAGLNIFNQEIRCQIVDANGNRHGPYEAFAKNGKLTARAMYKNGLQDGLYRVWRGDGTPLYEYMYQNGQKHGLHRFWHKNGRLESEFMYKNDEPDGIYRSWHQDGKIKSVGAFHNGKKAGTWIEHSLFDGFKCIEYYVNGQRICGVHNDADWAKKKSAISSLVHGLQTRKR